jgi:hypothetical protein
MIASSISMVLLTVLIEDGSGFSFFFFSAVKCLAQ